MKKKINVPNQPATRSFLTGTVATSAVSLGLLASAQLNLQAQENSEPVPVEEPQKPQAPPADAQDPAIEVQQSVNKFFNLGYTYCDAKVLAAYWNQKWNEKMTPLDAKVTLGGKLRTATDWDPGEYWMPRARAAALKKPAEEMPVDYTDAGYQYEDAELLSKFWGTSKVHDAKVKMEVLLTLGSEAVIKAALDEIQDEAERKAWEKKQKEAQEEPQGN